MTVRWIAVVRIRWWPSIRAASLFMWEFCNSHWNQSPEKLSNAMHDATSSLKMTLLFTAVCIFLLVMHYFFRSNSDWISVRNQFGLFPFIWSGPTKAQRIGKNVDVHGIDAIIFEECNVIVLEPVVDGFGCWRNSIESIEKSIKIGKKKLLFHPI